MPLPYLSPKEYVDKYGASTNNFVWPTDEFERSKLARAILGMWIVAKFDSWMTDWLSLLTVQTKKRRKRTFIDDHKNAYRKALEALSPDQKLIVRHLMFDIAHSMLFGTMVVFDQISIGECVIHIKPYKNGEAVDSPIQIAPLDTEDLHDSLAEWIWCFSKFSKELIEKVEHEQGWFMLKHKF